MTKQKSYRKSRRHVLKGGFLDSLGQTLSNWGSSLKTGASNIWSTTKKNIGMGSSSSTSYSTPSTSTSSNVTSVNASPSDTYSTPTASTGSTNLTNYSYGGKKSKKHSKTRKLRGGYHANSSLTNIASHAAPFSGNTARAHNWVGGKKHEKRRH